MNSLLFLRTKINKLEYVINDIKFVVDSNYEIKEQSISYIYK